MVSLEANALFRRLPPHELELLRRAATELSFTVGQEIFKEGDAGTGMFVVKDGLVEIIGFVGPNVRHTFSRVGAGEFFGEMAVLEDKPRSASAVAAQPTLVYFLPRDLLLAALGRSPDFSFALLREISHRLREFNLQFVREVLQSERLALVGRFARSIVHDLKNPLHVINLSAEMVNMAELPETARRKAAIRIRGQVDRITDMVNDLLDFTQGSHSTMVLALTPYDVFVHDVVEELRPELEMKRVAIQFRHPPPAVSVRVNPKRLCRVFHNLVHNAADVMPEGGEVALDFRVEGGAVLTEVADTGPGIAPQIAGNLFEPFATHGKSHGTGLGLSICKKAIEESGGWISARNADGRGAVFSFTLPLAK